MRTARDETKGEEARDQVSRVQSIGSKGWVVAWWLGSLTLSSDEPGLWNQGREGGTSCQKQQTHVGPFQRAGVLRSCLLGNSFAFRMGASRVALLTPFRGQSTGMR